MVSEDPGPIEITVSSVGGITSCELSLAPGVTILTGPNATNRTSFLTALAGTLGGSAGTLKTNASHGAVELAVGEDTYRRTYTRTEEGVTVAGSPLTDDTDLVDLYACLLESAPARRAVARGEDLRPIIMAPVDTGEIESTIEDHEAERAEIDDRLDDIDRKVGRLPALRDRATELRDQLETLEADLEQVRVAVQEADHDASRAEAAEELIETLESHRERRARLVEKRQTQERSIEALQSELDEIDVEIDDSPDPGTKLAGVESTIDELQARERSLARTVEELTTIVEFNADLLSGSMPAAVADADQSALTPRESDQLRCWTCGNDVEETTLSGHLSELRTVVDTKRAERREIAERLDSLRERRSRLRERQRSREERLDRRADIEGELSRRRKHVASIEDQIAALDDEIDDLQSEIESLELREDDTLDRYQELSDLQFRRGQLENELSDVEAEIDSLEGLKDEREQLRDRRRELDEVLSRLRTRIVDMERSAVETFNDHVARVLSLLEYDNIDRVWIERTVTGETPAQAASFDLHIARSDGDGNYEDTVATLSESEREVIGLLVALPGYLVHDVRETVPFMLLDSLEAIDADRIARLVDYFADHVTYLVVALLPDDAAALDDEYDRIPASEIGP